MNYDVDSAHLPRVADNAPALQREYQDYLNRFSTYQRKISGTALTFDAFVLAMSRWNEEYHSAWQQNDRDRMQELERLLAF